jgi:hypothetical protein
MVDEELGRDLLSFATPVLVLGDPAGPLASVNLKQVARGQRATPAACIGGGTGSELQLDRPRMKLQVRPQAHFQRS